MAILLVVVLLVFGAKRLPEMGRSLGHGLREFKDSVGGEGSAHLAPAELSEAREPSAAEDQLARPRPDAPEEEVATGGMRRDHELEGSSL